MWDARVRGPTAMSAIAAEETKGPAAIHRTPAKRLAIRLAFAGFGGLWGLFGAVLILLPFPQGPAVDWSLGVMCLVASGLLFFTATRIKP
jgi:fatty acid desaturase